VEDRGDDRLPDARRRAPPIAFVGPTLVDGTGATPVKNAVVVMREGRIACAGPRGACQVPATPIR